VAFAQGGTASLVTDPQARLRGIAALYLEPLWVFYRDGVPVRSLSDLAGRRVSVGLAASGTEAVATALLRDSLADGIRVAMLMAAGLALAAAASALLTIGPQRPASKK